MSPIRRLRLDKVQETIARLHLRIEERFPGSGLAQLACDLKQLGGTVEAQSAGISRPIFWVWALVVVSVGVLGSVILLLVGQANTDGTPTWTEMAQGIDAITSELTLMVALVIFLASWQTRIRRRRVVAAVRRLRELAHIVDMLQLTKDPGGIAGVSLPGTSHSPRRDLTPQELARYLDYCSELLSLIAKLAQFYVAAFDDPEATEAVTDLEDLADGLSRKIWQKIMILHQAGQAGTTV
jgi:hypothetical protein